MTGWENFFIAQAGAAAALAGLIFVGVSINLTKILSVSKLPSRAMLPLILLINILILSSLLLIPGQANVTAGCEVSILGCIVWILTTNIDLGILRQTSIPYKKQFIYNMILTQLAVLPFPVAGFILLLRGTEGEYWLVPGILISFLKAVIDAWVLLIEINR